jgi:hypothetical protein
MYTMHDDEHLKRKSASSSFLFLLQVDYLCDYYLHNTIPLTWHAPRRTLAMLFINAAIISHFFTASPAQMTMAGSWRLFLHLFALLFSHNNHLLPLSS